MSLIDLFPTLIELCGLDTVDDLDGVSLVPLMEKPGRKWDHVAMTTYLPGNYSIRSQNFRYILYSDGGEELYDHRSDPNEWHNLASNTKYAETKKRLARQIPQKAVPSIDPIEAFEFDPWEFTFERK